MDADYVYERTLNRRVGIRQIELSQTPIRDPMGFTFYFRVNGIAMYARGGFLDQKWFSFFGIPAS